jgi:hypothetical protein
VIQLKTQNNQQLNSLNVKLNFNKFLNTTSNYVLGVDIPSSSILNTDYQIDARYNYWLGKTTLPNIQQLIRDNFYDQTLVKANFVYFYQDEHLSQLNNQTTSGDFQLGSLVGGYLSKNFALDDKFDYYSVIADIIIDEDATLTINPGVTLYFNQTYSIICNGHLIINGNSTHKVKFHVFNQAWVIIKKI